MKTLFNSAHYIYCDFFHSATHFYPTEFNYQKNECEWNEARRTTECERAQIRQSSHTYCVRCAGPVCSSQSHRSTFRSGMDKERNDEGIKTYNRAVCEQRETHTRRRSRTSKTQHRHIVIRIS